uniref:Uncharacterized protein n=1 Tax=Oryza sativa subsp. japonica TaxID=39947 RepID=Q7XHV9_ORYSJ|nr:hypothetical protein [Oryza sativa Japonica Group]
MEQWMDLIVDLYASENTKQIEAHGFELTPVDSGSRQQLSLTSRAAYGTNHGESPSTARSDWDPSAIVAGNLGRHPQLTIPPAGRPAAIWIDIKYY